MKKMFLLTVVFLIAISQTSMLQAVAAQDLESLENKLTVFQDEEDFMSYRTEENGFIYDYEERTVADVVYTKKYRVTQSSRTLVEDSSTTVKLVDNILSLSVYDNINNTTEQIEINANNLDTEYSVMVKCSQVWPSGFQGKKPIVSGHQYAHNWKTNQGISRLGTLDIIVKTPDRKFDEYTRIVDSLIAQEKAAVPIVGTAKGLGELVKAIGKKQVTIATIKAAFKTIGKAVPGIGQIYTLVTYFNTEHKANVARDALKGTTKYRLGNC